MDDELKALFNYYSYKLEIIERNRQLEQQMFYAELECMQEQFNDVYLYEPVNDCTNTVDDSVEELEQQTTFTYSAVEITPNSPHEDERADTLEDNADIVDNINVIVELIDATVINFLEGCVLVSDQTCSQLALGCLVHRYINHTTAQVLTTISRGFALDAAACLMRCGSHNKVWKPGLGLA